MKNKKILLILVLATGLLITLISATKRAVPNKYPNEEAVEIVFENGSKIYAEVADSLSERVRGLSGRESLAPNSGMLFIFEKTEKPAFWMKDTLITLDILWIDSNKEIVQIERNAEPCVTDGCKRYPSKYPVLYVLETPGGWTTQNAIHENTAVSFSLKGDAQR